MPENQELQRICSAPLMYQVTVTVLILTSSLRRLNVDAATNPLVSNCVPEYVCNSGMGNGNGGA